MSTFACEMWTNPSCPGVAMGALLSIQRINLLLKGCEPTTRHFKQPINLLSRLKTLVFSRPHSFVLWREAPPNLLSPPLFSVLKSEVEACGIFRQATCVIVAFLSNREIVNVLAAGAAKNSCSSASPATRYQSEERPLPLTSHFPFAPVVGQIAYRRSWRTSVVMSYPA